MAILSNLFYRPESIVVEEISRKILSELDCNFSNVPKILVGIESRVEEMMRLLSIGLDDVRFLGIYGMGGIGKTTLSKVIYERVSHQFEASCFIADIREETRTHGLVYLQKQLIYEILMEKEINIWNKDGAIKVIANRVRNKKVFIVLDDVDGEEQLEALAGSHDWFGQGSRIIITSRDRHLLNGLVNNTYEVKELNDAKALQLFSWKAFKKSRPEKNYVELSKDVVNYAQGLPLALEVFGSFLFGRTMDEWKSARDRLKENPSAKILNKLQISFDGLEDLHKKLFLDIACFFNGARIDRIIHKLESFGYFPKIDLKVLEDKSLITISQRKLSMHDLLQKMGQKIVHCESAEDPGRRSRLWHIEDVLHVLKNDIGTDAVKGIVLKLPLQKQERLNVEAFSKMKKLKMLQISNTDIVRSFSKARDNLSTYLEWHGDPLNFMLSNELCVMEWWGYPFESLPTSFQPNNLVELIMCCGCIKQPFNGRKSFDKLKRIDLSYSQNLIETPDWSRIPNLEKLKLVGCTSLSKVHPSMGFLKQLRELDLQDCKRLKRLPNEISLESLEDLNLSGCSRLNKFPDIVGHMTSLLFLNLTRTAIKELPLSFKSLSSLLYLIISGRCSRLEKIPSSNVFLKKLRGSIPISLLIPSSFLGLSSLKTLDLSYCNLLDGAISNDLSCLSSLRSLNLSGNKFRRIPDSVAQLSQLWMLDLEDCSWLQVLPKLPLGLEKLRIKNCPLLEIFYNQMDLWTSTNCSFVAAYIDYDGKPCKILHLHPKSALWTQSDVKVSQTVLSKIAIEKCPGLVSIVVACGPALLGSGIPEWFNHRSPNSFGTIQMHIDLGSDEWKGYAFFIVYQVHEPDTYPRKTRKQKAHELENSKTTCPNYPYFVFRFQANEVRLRKPLVLCAPGVPSIGSNGFWVYIPAKWFRRRVRNSSSGWSNLEASITTGSQNVEVKECGARVVRQHDASEFYQVLNSISPHGLDLKSYENLFFHLDNGRLCLKVDGPIKGNQML